MHAEKNFFFHPSRCKLKKKINCRVTSLFFCTYERKRYISKSRRCSRRLLREVCYFSLVHHREVIGADALSELFAEPEREPRF